MQPPIAYKAYVAETASLRTSGINSGFLLEFPKSTMLPNERVIQNQNNKVHLIMDYINQHYVEPIVLSDLAEKVHLSKEYLCQLFKKVNGFSIFDYITDVRIAYAKTLLILNKNERIKEY
ncbi:AraC family transcriptional regulator [Neobacillus cucumis]|uniref:HTH araC/xylS-type domain-containing protein n=1 Tax=Neobacillus cucumis TaxID=1740721 RepID=A0A2N5HIR4_9BACI|nr:AraC family transcriptional regulator [Neobacillus cucumis]PLS05417.1 hypothetical protein CVD27_10485 [Neobacillus cucumis]